MPRDIKLVTIFISCPSNMGEYADHVMDVIFDYNEVFGYSCGVLYRTLYWKNNIVGQVSSDPQLAVNSQLMNEYDLLIGLIGERLGDPTPRAESGTAEEIEEALKKTDSIFGGQHVQVVFKSKFEATIGKIDLSQIQKVIDFKATLEKKAIIADFVEKKDLDGIVMRFLESATSHVLRSSGAAGSEANGSDADSLSAVSHGAPPEIVEQLGEAEKTGETGETEEAGAEAEEAELGLFDEMETSVRALEEQSTLISLIGDRLNLNRLSLSLRW